MTRRLDQIQRRRAELVRDAAEHRAAIATVYHRWRAPLSVVDRGLAALRFLKSRPALVAVAVMAAFTLRRAKLPTVAARVTVFWRLYRTYRSFLH